MHDEKREPSRLPVRGALAAIGTVGALALVLSFRGGPLAPGDPAIAADEPVASGELLPGEATELDVDDGEPVTTTGERIAIRWGEVQVMASIEGDDIVDVVTMALPDGDDHSVDISEYVEPILREEAITYDTADVAVISGATYTSEAYGASLQSALDQLGP